jgi:hypothetical protein
LIAPPVLSIRIILFAGFFLLRFRRSFLLATMRAGQPDRRVRPRDGFRSGREG